jgi:Putative prokaryotic signal transducing protein
MKRVYSGKDPLMIGHLKNVLETFGIRCVIKKSDLSSAAGELPPIECWPELWVVEDSRRAEAEAILKKTLAPLNSVKKPWRCDRCGEEIEGQFTECWKCGQSRSQRRYHSPTFTIASGSVRQR